MNNSIKILHLEDNKDSLKNFQEIVDIHNQQNKGLIVNIDVKSVSSLNEAFNLTDLSFDCAIVDLKLGDVDGAGCDYINSIQEKLLRIPTIIHTGTPDDAPTKNVVKTFTKGEVNYKEILEYILAIYKTGLTRIMGTKGIFEETLFQVFHETLLPHKDTWIEYSSNEKLQIEKSLLRYALNNIYYLLNNEKDQLLPEECYLKYQDKKPIGTGLLCCFKGKIYIVITPACDLANNKTTYLQLIAVDTFETVVIEQEKIKNLSLSSEKKKSLKEQINNNKIDCYHLLPKVNDFEAGYINFRKIYGINKEIFEKRINSKRVLCKAQISPYFIKDIIARFSSYYARQGQPLIVNLTQKV